MGYTHYWDFPETITSEQWRDIATFTHKQLAQAESEGIRLVGRSRNNFDTSPEVNEAYIIFNGYGEEEGHETFHLQRIPDGDFCKTARKPYDKIVEAILRHAETVVPEFMYTNDDMNSEVD